MKISVYLLALLMLVFVSCKDSSQNAEQAAPAEQAVEAAPVDAAPADAAPADAAPADQAAPAEEEKASGN